MEMRNKKTAKRPGPPPIKVDYNVLNALLQFKVKKSYVCDYLKISEDTLDRRLKSDFNMTFTEYHNLKIQKTAHLLQQTIIELALNKKNLTALIFSLKNIAGWSDMPQNEELITR